MELTKVRLTAEEVRIEYREANARGTRTVHYTSADAPLPEFKTALLAFRPYVLAVCGLREEGLSERLGVRGVTVSYDSTGRRGLTVTGLLEVTRSNAPLVLNTPLVWEESEEDEASPSFLRADELGLLATLTDQAERYLAGERAQMSLALD